MKQIELAQKLGVSKSYLSMMLSGQRRIPEHLEKPLCELVHKNQLQEVPSKQRVEGSNPSRDSTNSNACFKRRTFFEALFFLELPKALKLLIVNQPTFSYAFNRLTISVSIS